MTSQIEAHNYRCFPKLAIGLDHYHALDLPILIGGMLRWQALTWSMSSAAHRATSRSCSAPDSGRKAS